jgi:predicted ATPase/DNA-binding winged helix-turn-helix (wHTH) protein
MKRRTKNQLGLRYGFGRQFISKEQGVRMDGTVGMPARCFSFGRFKLLANQQRLLRDDRPVRIGSRALAILSVLIEHAGDLVSKEDLISQVWPDTFVDESNLKVNIAALRKVLDEKEHQSSHILTECGRGYRFATAVNVCDEEDSLDRRRRASNLPHSLNQIVGRGEAIQQVIAQMTRCRLLTIYGSPGVGKTTVAIAAAEALLQIYPGLFFVDLSRLHDPSDVPHAISAALGLPITQNANEQLISHLRNQEILLVLDTCEHVLCAAADWLELIHSCCPTVHILATSREPLGVKGERLYRLPPLDVPPVNQELTVESIRAFPAVELFLKLATEAPVDLTIDDSQALLIAELCRQLDGVPLAIELAAVRVRLLGFEGLASVANDHFLQFRQPQRTGPRRHHSLAAAYEWSFDLLTERERSALLRLCTLTGSFDLETAVAVASNRAMSTAETTTSIATLVSKSLIEHLGQGESTFRLLTLVRFFGSKVLRPTNIDKKTEKQRPLLMVKSAGNSMSGARRSGVRNSRNRVVAIAQSHA